MENSQPWQCPACKTWYAPHVEKCECQKGDSRGIVITPQPYKPTGTAVWPWTTAPYIGDPPYPWSGSGITWTYEPTVTIGSGIITTNYPLYTN